MGVLEWLAERGFTSVEEVTTVTERRCLRFPRELRPPRAKS